MLHLGAVDVLVNNAGSFITKAFMEFTTDDFNALMSVNLVGFLHMTQAAVDQMVRQGSGCVIMPASLSEHPANTKDS